jgi:hypothetical protein
MRALILVGLVATTALAQAPESVGGNIYHEHSAGPGDYLPNGRFGSTSFVTVLRTDGTYSTIYRVDTIHILPGGSPPIIPISSVGSVETGNYAYVKTSERDATLTLTSSGGPGAWERKLSFVSDHGGSVGRPLTSDYTGEFWLSSFGQAPVMNVSARGTASASKPLIVGFYVSGRPRLVLIRGVGPALSQFDVPNAAEDSTIAIVASSLPDVDLVSLGRWNDDWEVQANPYPLLVPGAVSPAETVGAFTGAFVLPSGSKDAALVVELPPGSYTALIRTKSEIPAEVLGEIYVVP